METAILITLFIHLLGMAALVGGSLAQVKEKTKKVTSLMRDGAITQLITGPILVGLVQANDETVNNGVMSVKFTFLAVILVLLYLGRKKLSNRAYWAIVALSVANVLFALFVVSE